MHGPVLSCWLLVALCAATGAYCLVRVRGRSGEARRTAGGEALMGFGMAVMAVPAAVVAFPRWTWTVYTVVFGATAFAALWAARRGARHLHHLIGSLAMVYMALAMAPGSGHGGHTAAGTPLLTGVLLGYYVMYVLRSGVRLVPVPSAAGAPAGPSADPLPGLLPACRLVMGLAMVAMLITL
ncbi:DUF5134 domain-containing protein [Streptomyces sp. NPDC051018]|uniref:DUF5134 domain-containing protein n=1 Tax=Streptomyces sp. NPDC051018 TaxID=3365639 RepID=UPI00378AAFDE